MAAGADATIDFFQWEEEIARAITSADIKECLQPETAARLARLGLTRPHAVRVLVRKRDEDPTRWADGIAPVFRDFLGALPTELRQPAPVTAGAESDDTEAGTDVERDSPTHHKPQNNGDNGKITAAGATSASVASEPGSVSTTRVVAFSNSDSVVDVQPGHGADADADPDPDAGQEPPDANAARRAQCDAIRASHPQVPFDELLRFYGRARHGALVCMGSVGGVLFMVGLVLSGKAMFPSERMDALSSGCKCVLANAYMGMFEGLYWVAGGVHWCT